MIHLTRKLFLALAISSIFAAHGAAATLLGSIPITGAEQSSGGVWDTGTVTVTVNGSSISYAYGQFSKPASIASGLGALISNSCSFPVRAQASGATLNLYQKGSTLITSASIASTSNNPTLFASNSFLVAGGGNWTAPQISSLSLPEGPAGMGFNIYGSNFGSAQGTVSIGSVAATIVDWSLAGTSITVQVPNGLTASPIPYSVMVVTSTWTFNSGTTFQVDAPFGCN